MFKWQNIQMVERGENCKNQASIQLCMYVYELFMSMQKNLQWVEIRKKMSFRHYICLKNGLHLYSSEIGGLCLMKESVKLTRISFF